MLKPELDVTDDEENKQGINYAADYSDSEKKFQTAGLYFTEPNLIELYGLDELLVLRWAFYLIS